MKGFKHFTRCFSSMLIGKNKICKTILNCYKNGKNFRKSEKFLLKNVPKSSKSDLIWTWVFGINVAKMYVPDISRENACINCKDST